MHEWMYRLLRKEDDEGGGGEADDDTKDKAEPDKTRAVDVMSMPLGDDDSIPEKLRGKSVADLLKSYSNAEKRLTRTIEDAKKTASDPGNKDQPLFEEGFFANLMDEATAKGEVDAEILKTASEKLGIGIEDLNDIAGFVHQRRQQVLKTAQSELGDEVDVQALLDWASADGRYDDLDIESFNRMLRRGSIEPFRLIMEDMIRQGIDPKTMRAPAGERAMEPDDRRARLRRGTTATPPEQKGFESRGEYVRALQAAKAKERETGDSSHVAAVDERLKKSNVRSWPDRHV